MTLEERFEKLTERHEALTHSLELLSHLHQEGERRITRLEQIMTALAEAQVKTEDSINRLAHIAAAHEQRLDDIEGQ